MSILSDTSTYSQRLNKAEDMLPKMSAYHGFNSSIIPVSRKQSRFKRLMNCPLQLIDDKFQAGSVRGSVFTLVNSAFGAGVVIIPYAISQAGLGLGIIELVLCAVLNLYSTRILAISGSIAKKYTYAHIAKEAYGTGMEYIARITVLINCWGACVLTTIIIGQLLSRAFTIFFGDSIPAFNR
jgi:hypothetical protein